MRIPHFRSLAAFAIAALSSTSLSAQAPSRILALTQSSGQLLTLGKTNCAATVCAPGLGPALAPYAGGTAHDPRDRHTWISDGFTLMKVDARAACTVLCSLPAPLATAANLVTGLALNEETQTLFISYSNNTISAFQVAGCGLTFLYSCPLALPPNHIVSGLATEDATGEIYFVSGPWAGSSSVSWSVIHRALQTSPCTVLCTFTLNGCDPVLPSTITGLAFDACTRDLFATEGTWIHTVTNTWTCSPTHVNCCFPPVPPGDLLSGLCILPSTETSTGIPCTGGSAPTCPNLAHVLGGDPTIGNLGFSLDMINAPMGSYAFCFIDIGPCSGGSTYSVLCDLLMPTIFYSPHIIPPGTGCGGSASSPFPIPNLPVLCGIVLNSQFVGQIPPGWSGSYVTNCLTWMISAS